MHTRNRDIRSIGLLNIALGYLRGAVEGQAVQLTRSDLHGLSVDELDRKIVIEGVPRLAGQLKKGGPLDPRISLAALGAVELVIARLKAMNPPEPGSAEESGYLDKVDAMEESVMAAVELLNDDKIWSGQPANAERAWAILSLLRAIGYTQFRRAKWRRPALARLGKVEDRFCPSYRPMPPTTGGVVPALDKPGKEPFRRHTAGDSTWLVARDAAVGRFLDLFSRGPIGPTPEPEDDPDD